MISHFFIKQDLMRKNRQNGRTRKEEMHMEIAEAWNNIVFGQLIREFALIIESILKNIYYIVLIDTYIIIKNFIRKTTPQKYNV